jgi:glycosyltransferase involved in cell wall biosynthesis
MITPTEPPVIAPVVGSDARPLWSVMIPTYNSTGFLQETLRAVLLQDLGPQQMEIEVVDDASTDSDVELLVKTVGEGRVRYFRQPHNVGHLLNFKTCIDRARGRVIHLLHADDKVLPGYYAKMTSLFERFPTAGAAFCRLQYRKDPPALPIEQPKESIHDGILENWLMRIAEQQRIQYCAISVRRDVFEHLGSFYGVQYGEDWEMWVRIAKHYPVVYTPDLLAEYRIHGSSISGQLYQNADNMKALRWVICAIQAHLPAAVKAKALRAAHVYYAHYALMIAFELWHQSRNAKAAFAQIREAMRMHVDKPLLGKIARLCFKITFNRI